MIYLLGDLELGYLFLFSVFTAGALWDPRERLARLTKQGNIRLHVEFREDRNDLLFQVRDTGPGVPADQLTQIFEEFQQAPEISGTSGTSGLGLTISQRIVELHGGHMWAESIVGQGSAFSFALPVYHLSPPQFTRDGTSLVRKWLCAKTPHDPCLAHRLAAARS